VSSLGPVGLVLRCSAVLLLIAVSETKSWAQTSDGAINQIIQSPAPMSGGIQAPLAPARPKPQLPVARTIEPASVEDTDVNAVIRALSPREIAPPIVLTLASTTFISELTVEVRRWSPLAFGRLLPDEIVAASVAIQPIPETVAVTWQLAPQYGVIVTQTQIALIEQSSRRVAIVIDKATGVAIGPQARFILVQDSRTSRTIILDLHASFEQDVYFANSSSALSPKAREQLLAIGMALQSPTLRGTRFLISGHTNSVGTDLSNRELSFRRAVAVREYLSRNFGVPLDQIEIYGFGADRLKYPYAPRHPGNRRVEIALVIGERL
jgi:outer membrane protein OmpA-like peptidoglycan-associated protein